MDRPIRAYKFKRSLYVPDENSEFIKITSKTPIEKIKKFAGRVLKRIKKNMRKKYKLKKKQTKVKREKLYKAYKQANRQRFFTAQKKKDEIFADLVKDLTEKQKKESESSRDELKRQQEMQQQQALQMQQLLEQKAQQQLQLLEQKQQQLLQMQQQMQQQLQNANAQERKLLMDQIQLSRNQQQDLVNQQQDLVNQQRQLQITNAQERKLLMDADRQERKLLMDASSAERAQMQQMQQQMQQQERKLLMDMLAEQKNTFSQQSAYERKLLEDRIQDQRRLVENLLEDNKQAAQQSRLLMDADRQQALQMQQQMQQQYIAEQKLLAEKQQEYMTKLLEDKKETREMYNRQIQDLNEFIRQQPNYQRQILQEYARALEIKDNNLIESIKMIAAQNNIPKKLIEDIEDRIENIEEVTNDGVIAFNNLADKLRNMQVNRRVIVDEKGFESEIEEKEKEKEKSTSTDKISQMIRNTPMLPLFLSSGIVPNYAELAQSLTSQFPDFISQYAKQATDTGQDEPIELKEIAYASDGEDDQLDIHYKLPELSRLDNLAQPETEIKQASITDTAEQPPDTAEQPPDTAKEETKQPSTPIEEKLEAKIGELKQPIDTAKQPTEPTKEETKQPSTSEETINITSNPDDYFNNLTEFQQGKLPYKYASKGKIAVIGLDSDNKMKSVTVSGNKYGLLTEGSISNFDRSINAKFIRNITKKEIEDGVAQAQKAALEGRPFPIKNNLQFIVYNKSKKGSAKLFNEEEEEKNEDEEDDIFKRDYLYDDEIYRILKPYGRIFGGVADIDNFDTLMSELWDQGRYKFGIVINTSKENEKGEHWQGLYFDPLNKQTVEFYDSYGDDPDKELVDRLENFIESLNLPVKLKFKINKIQHQNNKSEHCGYFVVRFLSNKFEGSNFAEATNFNIDNENSDFTDDTDNTDDENENNEVENENNEVENENNEVENDDEPAKSKNQTKIAENEIKKHKDVLRKKIAFGYL